MTVSSAPSSIVLRAADASASIHPEAGGRLGQLDLGDGPLLRGPAAELGWADWGCFALLPWSNRIPGGHLRFGDLDAHLPVNWPDGSAIHGLVADRPWTVLDRSDRSAELEVRAATGPYRVRGMQSFHLEPDRLRLRLSVRNEGDRTVPVGLGIHPWFRSGPIRVPADERRPGEPLPSGPPESVSGDDDLRRPTVPPPMDADYTTLTGTTADVAGVALAWDGPVTDVIVFTKEPGWAAVEPVTMANNAFALPPDEAQTQGVRLLEPGADLEVRYEFRRGAIPR